jgi:hypothetical protein
MGYSAVIQAIQQGHSVYQAYLVKLEFRSQTMFLWLGSGPFKDANGQVWQGLGQLAAISDFDRDVVSGQTPTLTLSGVDPQLASAALASSSEIKGRWVTIFDQYFDGSTLGYLEAPKAVFTGLMDRATMQIEAAKASISVTTLTALYRRRRPALAYLSDATQRTLYPADAGLSEIGRLVQATEIWPGYNG